MPASSTPAMPVPPATLGALSAPGVSHRLVARPAGEMPHGVVAPLELVALVTRP
jgi:hypothetical protein